MRKSITYTIGLLAVSAAGHAAQTSAVPDYIATSIPNASVADTGHASYMMFDLYDATLYRPRDSRQETQPLALSITYRLSVGRDAIADRAVEEIRNQGFHNEIKLAAWHESLRTIIPDIQAGATLTGIRMKNGESVFYHNGRFIGKIADPQFGEFFFNIWLAENTDEPILWNMSM